MAQPYPDEVGKYVDTCCCAGGVGRRDRGGPGETVPNMAVVGVHSDSEGSGAQFSLADHAGSVDVIGDIAGYFAANA